MQKRIKQLSNLIICRIKQARNRLRQTEYYKKINPIFDRFVFLFKKNKVARLIFLILLVMAIFGYSNGRFILVKAFNAQLNLYPGKFSLEQDYLFDEDLIWTNLGKRFFTRFVGTVGILRI
jgi:hypothetical protein